MLFNLPHILYMLISGLITALLLFLAARFVKKESHKSLILKVTAVVTVLIHYSDLVVDFFKNSGDTPIASVHILPVYPCNIIMWMLLILAFIENKKRLIPRLLAEFCLIVGTICGIVGIVLNINYNNSELGLMDYDILKGMLSHSTMLFGCIYIYFCRYFKLGVFNTLSLFAGFLIFVICGLTVDGLYVAHGMEPPDGIFIKEVPYIGISSIPLGAALLVVVFGILALLEQRLPKEERWYSKIGAFIKSIKNKNKED